MSELTRRIRAGRAYAGFSSHRDLAQAAGVSEATIQRYEAGKTVPDDEKLERIAAACRLPVSFFLDDDLRVVAAGLEGLVERLERSAEQLNQAAMILGGQALKEAALAEAQRSRAPGDTSTRRKQTPRAS